jgi:hypothetical protein
MLHIYHSANELRVRIGLFGAAPFFLALPGHSDRAPNSFKSEQQAACILRCENQAECLV